MIEWMKWIWQITESEDAMTHDVTTTLRSELAALEYKRDRLMSEVSFAPFGNWIFRCGLRYLTLVIQLQDMKSAVRSRDQRVVELQVEADQLREQAARQNAVISSLKKRIQVRTELIEVFFHLLLVYFSWPFFFFCLAVWCTFILPIMERILLPEWIIFL